MFIYKWEMVAWKTIKKIEDKNPSQRTSSLNYFKFFSYDRTHTRITQMRAHIYAQLHMPTRTHTKLKISVIK